MPGRLYIAAKPPVPGLVKTRLARTIGAAASARLYAEFLEDIAAVVRTLDVPAGWFIPPGTGWLPPALGASQLPTRWQRGDSWGARQARLFSEVLAEGPGPVVLMASDSPQLGVADLDAAFTALSSCDVVLGPVLDGGYYLVGMHHPHDVLAAVEMSTGTVCADVLEKCRDRHLATTVLPARFDVDEACDLDLLAASDALHLVATRAWLAGAAVVSLA